MWNHKQKSWKRLRTRCNRYSGCILCIPSFTYRSPEIILGIDFLANISSLDQTHRGCSIDDSAISHISVAIRASTRHQKVRLWTNEDVNSSYVSFILFRENGPCVSPRLDINLPILNCVLLTILLSRTEFSICGFVKSQYVDLKWIFIIGYRHYTWIFIIGYRHYPNFIACFLHYYHESAGVENSDFLKVQLSYQPLQSIIGTS